MGKFLRRILENREKRIVDHTKIKQSSEYQAATAALIGGCCAHAFGLVNILHNYDNILQQPKGFGAGITSGRWLLQLLGDFFQDILDLGYNTPVLNGLVYLGFIALSAAFVVNLLHITGKRAVLTGCLMATFPTTFDTMIFRYTAPYYGMAFLLSVLAAWLLSKKRWGLPLSALCLSLSMGIYQAYPPMTIGLLVLRLMADSLEKDADLKTLIRKGVWCVLALIFGVLLYFAMLKLVLALYSIQKPVALDNYQGISTMGQIPLSCLPYLVAKAWFVGATFTLTDYCGLVVTPVFKVIWTSLVLVTVLMACYFLFQKKQSIFPRLFFCLMGLLFPLACNFIMVMCPDAKIYAIMAHSFVLVAIAPLMLLEYLPIPTGKPKTWLSRGISLLTACIIFYNSYYGNMNDTAQYYANRQIENYFSGLYTQIRMTEGFTRDKTLAFLGDQFDDPKLWNLWNVEPSYGGFASTKTLLNASYSSSFWVLCYLGYETDGATRAEKDRLWQDPRVKEMPCWPDEGSIRVVDGFLVVKLQEGPQ